MRERRSPVRALENIRVTEWRTNPGTGKARIELSSPSLITEINNLLFGSSQQIVSAGLLRVRGAKAVSQSNADIPCVSGGRPGSDDFGSTQDGFGAGSDASRALSSSVCAANRLALLLFSCSKLLSFQRMAGN
jgi:hypothetical protein